MSPAFRKLLMAATLVAVMGMVALVTFRGRLPQNSAVENSFAEATTNSLARRVAPLSPSAVDDYRAAVLASFREANPAERSLAFSQSFTVWFAHDPEAALDWLRLIPRGREYTQGIFIVLPAICQQDPQRALILAEAMATTHEQKFIYHALFDQLAKNNLSSAVGWLQSAPAGEARENSLRAVMDNWTLKDASAALAWAKNLEDAGERSAALESALTTLAAGDPQKTIELASQNLEGGALDRVLQTSLQQLATENPQAAAEAVGQLPAGELQKNSALSVARSLAAQDPNAAMTWLQTLPADTQPVVLNNVLEVWLKQDATAAGKYVSEMSAGSAQDSAVSHFAENWAEKDPAAAVNWAESLSNTSAQNAAVISLASGWARMDPAAAVRWTAELPAENPARIAALRGAYSYWDLTDKTTAGNFLETLPAADREAIKPSTLAQK